MIAFFAVRRRGFFVFDRFVIGNFDDVAVPFFDLPRLNLLLLRNTILLQRFDLILERMCWCKDVINGR